MKRIFMHTDGACSGNQDANNIGGWGTILEYGNHTKELFGGEINTTNNRMEMTALLKGLQAINKKGMTIWAFSDSSYLINCFREKWYLNWLRNNWKTSKKTAVENRDLWESLLCYLDIHRIDFFKVKGHVNLQSKSVDQKALFRKFKEWNGDRFTMEDFQYITLRNNRADALANMGIEQIRKAD
jgi:ribonuclease HI